MGDKYVEHLKTLSNHDLCEELNSLPQEDKSKRNQRQLVFVELVERSKKGDLLKE